jgi:hypothetical protein
MSTYSADLDPIADSHLDSLAAELGAMQVIAKALAEIRDRETRRRVLAWADAKFSTAPPPPAPLPARAAAARAADEDPTLSVDSLYEFFEQPRSVTDLVAFEATAAQRGLTPAAADVDPRPELEGRPIKKLVRVFARRLELLAAEWQTA